MLKIVDGREDEKVDYDLIECEKEHVLLKLGLLIFLI